MNIGFIFKQKWFLTYLHVFPECKKNAIFRTTLSIIYIMVLYIESTRDHYGVDPSKVGLMRH